MLKKPVVLDIFCGAGGMSEGFIQAGFDVRFASDINKSAKATYLRRHEQLGYETKFALEDIRKFSQKRFLNKFLDNTEVDIVCGGPPCQGFSLAGKRNQKDPRNMLFKSYIMVIKNVKPKYFIMENVDGIRSMKFDEYIGLKNEVYINRTVPEILVKEFLKIGYKLEYRVLQASDYGVPQNRRRVFFLGHKIRRFKNDRYRDLVTPPEFPVRNIERYISIEEAIDDLSFLDAGHKSSRYKKDKELSDYQKNSIKGRTLNIQGNPISTEVLFNHEASRHSEKVIDRFTLMNQGEDINMLKKRIKDEEWDRHKTKKNICRKVRANEPSPTVLTLPDDLIHYSKNRIMTVREFARIQSFDDSFEFVGKRTTGGDRRKTDLPQYTQVGNAVPPLLAKAVAEEVMKAYQKTYSSEEKIEK